MDKKKIFEIALNFVSKIDKDRTGTIEFEEFYEAFADSKEAFLTDDNIHQLFNEIDVSGDGIITLIEFSKALYMILDPD